MKLVSVLALAIAACGGRPAPAPAAPANTGGAAPATASAPAAAGRVFDFSGDTIQPDPLGVAAPPSAPPEAAVDKAAIHRELRRHVGELARCVAQDATATGTIELVFGVASSGAIGDVYVNGPGAEATKACLAASLKSLRFAPDPAGRITEVHFPLTVQRPTP